MLWDLFCRVIDNHGDAGVCWRLAADLASRGEQVRLWIDDSSALGWMAPVGAAGVSLHRWPTATQDQFDGSPPQVVVEAFGCDLPPAVIARMAAQSRPPVWINLEYLSAEGYVESSHRLRSPQFGGAGAGLDKWFFYPGFTIGTGGLLREPGLAMHRDRFKAPPWLARHGWSPLAGEQIVTLFCYDNPQLPRLLGTLAASPTLLLVCPGPAQRALDALPLPDHLRRINLPWLSQQEFDHLLWSADLNFVRGEDSLVRAMWAGSPFIWQIYPQHDQVHAVKLEAFADRVGMSIGPLAASDAWARWRALLSAWNGLGPWPDADSPLPELVEHFRAWRAHLLAQTDLATQLLSFVAEKR